MSISYADSLKQVQGANENPTEIIAPASFEEPVMAILTEDTGVQAYAGETWTRDTKYLVYSEYVDEQVSLIDKNKNILLDVSQLNITQESNSQYIPFQLDRYFDGYDLTKAVFVIHFVNKDGYEDFANPINVEYNSTSIRLGWLVDYRVTAVAGKVQFEIQAMGTNSKGDSYIWRTRPHGGLDIIKSLSGNGIIEPNQDWTSGFLELISEHVAEARRAARNAKTQASYAANYASQAQTQVNTAKELIRSTQAQLEGTVADAVEEKVNTAMGEYYEKTEVDALLAALDFDDLQDFNVVYEEPLLKFYNGETVIKEITIYSDPSDGWKTAYNTVIDNKIVTALGRYYTKTQVDELLENIDISEQLEEVKQQIANIDGLAAFNVTYDGSTMTFYNGAVVMNTIEITSDPTDAWTSAYTTEIESKITAAVSELENSITEDLNELNTSLSGIESDITNIESEIVTLQNDLANINPDVTENHYTKTETDAKYATKEDLENTNLEVAGNKQNISAISEKVIEIDEVVNSIDKSPRLSYEATYSEDQIYTLWEIEGEGDGEVRTPKGQFKIVGGGGGTSTSSVLKIEYVTKTPVVATINDRIVLVYSFSGVDSSGDPVTEATATWRIGNTTLPSHLITAGENTFDVTDYISLGTQKVLLSVTDDAGSLVTKSWTVQKVDVRIESSFNDKVGYPIAPVVLGYTPYGSIPKTVHFVLDGEEIGTFETSTSGLPMDFIIPVQEHGAHLLELYMTASINNNPIESNHILKDILWVDPNSEIPVIGTIYQNITARQYETTNIIATVIDPTTESPTVELVEEIDGEDHVISTLSLTTSSTFTWQYKSSEIGKHILKIKCKDQVKHIEVLIEKIDIDVAPVTGGLVFDFDPSSKNNSDVNRDWSYGDIKMITSSNFDWVNGGYQTDSNGDKYFCIKAGTSAEIDYQLFADDAKKNGKEFKLVFKTTNVAKPDAVFLHCLDNTTGDDHVGVQMSVHEANIYSQVDNLQLPYSEGDIIEFEFNISKNTEEIPMIMGYEDGVSTRPMVYDGSYNFTQNNPKTISLGSTDCDLHIYRFKVYNTSLSATHILKNFIADARNADEMIDRYNRNEIYDENELLDPDVLAVKCPWLKVYKLSAPYFTRNKDDKVPGTTIQQLHKGGDPILDNWTAYNSMHSGQGASSNNYGAAGRNLDFIMNNSGVEGLEPYFIMGDGSRAETITLSRTSVPVAYLNAKVNIASSNNMTNAMLAKKYNEFNPYKRPFIREEGVDTSFIKDTMEFYNCVIFIQETDPDLTTHREFADNDWHFYAIGNVGDSKKTDKTRLTDMNDPYECCVEIMDVRLPLSDFPANTMYNAMGYTIDDTTKEKIYTWAKNENLGILHELIDGEYVLTEDTEIDLNKTYYVDILEHDDFSEDFTYGWRYISNKKDPAIVNACKEKWIELYRFITTSTDEEFKAHLADYFIVDSALYNYLFTTRYCMVDNRAKNTFWHYSKTGEVDAQGNPIRKWDLNWDYDNDKVMSL